MGGSDFQTRVLVVDDEPIILETMTAILKSQGFAVRTAEDGFAALVTLRQTPPDIIISDLRMPNMSGFEFLSVVRRRFPHIPVIAISGEYVAAGIPPGLLMDAFLQKGGYTQQQLFDTIRRLIGDSRYGLTRRSPTMLRFGFRVGRRTTLLPVAPIVCDRSR